MQNFYSILIIVLAMSLMYLVNRAVRTISKLRADVASSKAASEAIAKKTRALVDEQSAKQ